MLKGCMLFKAETNVLRISFNKSFCSLAALSLNKANDSKVPIKSALKETNQSDDRKRLATRFVKYLKCTEEEAKSLIRKNKELSTLPTLKLRKNIDFLIQHNVTTTSIVENPWLLGIPFGKTISRPPPFRNQLNEFFVF